MKNQKLFKILGIIILAVIVLTWIIPSTSYNATGDLELGKIQPAGISDLFGSIDLLLVYFTQNSIILLLIGGLYGVMNKTGSYKMLVDDITKKFKNKEKYFLISTVLFYGLISSLTSISFVIFAFVPLTLSILANMGVSKKVGLLSTIGAFLIAKSSKLFVPFTESLGIEGENTFIFFKLAFLVISLVLVILYVLKTSKVKPEKEELINENIIKPEKRDSENKSKKGSLPLLITLSVFTLIMILGLTKWNFDFFNTIHAKITDFSIGDFAIFKNIIGSAINPFGMWSYAEIYTVIVVTAIAIGLIYKLKIKEFFESFVSGLSKFLGIAAVVLLINIILILTLNSGFLTTILNALAKSGNTALVTLSSIITSPFITDPIYVSQYTMGTISKIVGESYNINLLALILQISYGLTMLIVPTSAMLLAGLIYLEESFTKWIKYIWKLLVVLFLLSFIVITIAALI